MTAFFVGFYLGGMVTEVVASLHAEISKFEIVKAAVLWPYNTLLAAVSLFTKVD